MEDLISRKAAIDEIRKCRFVVDAIEKIRGLPSANGMTFEEIAQLLSDLFGECACDVNDNDEWLPQACKYADTQCPHPKEKNGCWMQFLLQGGADSMSQGRK